MSAEVEVAGGAAAGREKTETVAGDEHLAAQQAQSAFHSQSDATGGFLG